MARKKGSPKYGGRKRGTPNRSTEQLRSAVHSFVEHNWDSIQIDYDAMKPAERLSFINSLLRHVLPDPISIERLTESQLDQLYEYLLKKYADEQAN